MNDLGQICRALNLNPSLETLEKLGETKKRGNRCPSLCFYSCSNTVVAGEKFISFEEFLSIFSQLKKEIKDQGCYEDFVECLKLYDKEENGKMLLGELHHSLVTLGIKKKRTCRFFFCCLTLWILGEKLTEDQVDILFEDCLDSENSEGEIEYDRKLAVNWWVSGWCCCFVAFLRRMCEKAPPLDRKKKPAAKAK